MSSTAGLPLFNMDAALQRRDAAMRWVAANPENRRYRDLLIEAIEELARTGATFTADHVRTLAGDPPEGTSPNLTGAIINHAAKRGLIEMVGYGRSAREIGHGNTVRVWRGRRVA